MSGEKKVLTLAEILEKLRQRRVAREQGAASEGSQPIPSTSSAVGGGQTGGWRRESASRWTEDDLVEPNKEQPIWFPEQNVRRLGRSRSIASILPKDEPSSQLTPGRGRQVLEATPVFPQPEKSFSETFSERMEAYRLMLVSREQRISKSRREASLTLEDTPPGPRKFGAGRGRGREVNPLLDLGKTDSFTERFGALKVSSNPDWRRFRNRSPPPNLAREVGTSRGPAVGSRMYTFGSNPGHLMETQSPHRTLFYDPRKQTTDRKNDRHTIGTAETLKLDVFKHTRIVFCSPEEIPDVEKKTFGYSRVKQIGKGAFGYTLLATRNEGENLAIKVLGAFPLMFITGKKSSKNLQTDEKTREALLDSLNEVIVMRALKGHPYFVQYIEHFIINEDIYIVMELEDGTLAGQLKRFRRGMPEAQARKWFFQMANGIAHMHKIGIVHGDIKKDNVLIRQLADGTTICKWLDFGISSFMPHALNNIKGWISTDRDHLKRVFATPKFRGPDVNRILAVMGHAVDGIKLRKTYGDSKAHDIVDLGRILAQMMGVYSMDTDNIQYSPKKDFLNQAFMTGERKLSRTGKDFLWTIVQKDEATRVPIEQLVKHVWLLRPGIEPGFVKED